MKSVCQRYARRIIDLLKKKDGEEERQKRDLVKVKISIQDIGRSKPSMDFIII